MIKKYYNQFWKYKKDQEKVIIKEKSYYVTFCCGKNSKLRNLQNTKRHFYKKHLKKV